MNKLYKLLTAFLLFFVSYQVNAQQRVLEIDSFRFDSDTIAYGERVNFSYKVTNISDSGLSFSGDILTWLKTDLESNPSFVQRDSNLVIPNKTSHYISGSIHVINPYFDKSQKTIVVVWPTGTGNVRFENKVDSIRVGLQVENNVSVEETKNLVKYVRFYPNPNNGTLHIETLNSQVQIKRIQLTDLQGKNIELKFDGFNREIMDLRNHRAGLYIMQVELSNGEKATYRIIKSE